jgi:autoinducer 2 (AI-2) kinase
MEELREQLALTVRDLYRAGLITPVGGNVSCRAGRGYLITPSGRHKGRLEAKDMVLLDAGGRPLEPGRPSVEAGMHLAVYAKRPDAGAVVHSHGPQGILLGVTGLAVFPASLESLAFLDLPRVAFMLPGSEELANAAANAMVTAPAALLVNHGAITAGPCLDTAATLSHALEAAAGLSVWLHALQLPATRLEPEMIRQLKSYGIV